MAVDTATLELTPARTQSNKPSRQRMPRLASSVHLMLGYPSCSCRWSLTDAILHVVQAVQTLQHLLQKKMQGNKQLPEAILSALM